MKHLLFLFLFVSSWLNAQVYEFNTQSLGQWNGAGETYSDIWGYTALGREYAILGSAQYIYFFDVTNPTNIQLVDKFGPYTATSWREFKTYSHYAYAVTDGPDAGGLRIFDLQYLPDTVIQVRQTSAFFTKCHMPFIDEAKGRLYCAGTNTRNNGIIVLDLTVRPDSPSLVINQALPRGYVHDVYVKNNVMYASHIYSGYLSQYDCTGSSCTGELSTFQTGGYNHSSWMNADQSLLINAIETAGHPLWLFHIEGNGIIGNENYKQFKSFTLKDQYPALPVGEGSIGHNPYIVGDRAYVSYYTDGVQVYNISDVNNVRRVAYFDTDRGYTSYSPVFRGCWGTYPFLPSGNILASDIQSGLWIFKTTPCANSQPPTINISSQATTYPRGSSFTVNASVADSDGTPVKVEFYNDGVLLATDIEQPFLYTIAQVSDNGYKFTAKVYDDCGIPTESAILIIAIDPSCDDGIQNGDETGVDCGGSSCTACSQGCPSPTNLSLGKTASQSSNYDGTTPASDAVDGSTASSSWQCSAAELQPWWQVDLGSNYQVSSIELTHRTGCTACTGRIKKFRVFVTPSPVGSFSTAGYVYEYTSTTGLGNGQVLNIPNLSGYGRYVKIWVDNGNSVSWMHFAEVKVMGCNGADPCTNNQVPNIPVVTSSQTSYPRNSSFSVNCTASDPDGTISGVEFYNDGNLLGADNTFPYSYTINNASASSYNITAKAIDNCNGIRTSVVLTINTTVSCSDGIQNGDETGMDCGGSTCTACTQGCSSATNVSLGKTASQSSSYDGTTPASEAVDGSISSSSWQCSAAEIQPWWQVDLGSNYQVSSIELTHRTGCTACTGRIKKFRVFVTVSPVGSYSTAGYDYEYTSTTGLGDGQVLNIPDLSGYGRYVKIWVDNGNSANWMHFAEVKVMGCNGVDPCTNNQVPNIPVVTSSQASYPRNSSFSVNCTASDPDGTINMVEFYNDRNLLAVDNTFPYSYTINSAWASNYDIMAKAIDNCNGSRTSGVLTITTTVSCSDGFQNGDETGVDCGGTTCTGCVQGCSSPTNLSQGKTASQSSSYDATTPASDAVDGSTASSSWQCSALELQPWWQVDLGSNYQVSSIELTHRTGCTACTGRIKKFRVFVTPNPVGNYSTAGYVYEYSNTTGLGNGQELNIPDLSAYGRYVRIWVDNGNSANWMHFAEVKVMGCNGVDPCTNNQTPTISVVTSSQTSYPRNSSFSVNCTASDPDGTINMVEFYNDGNLLAVDNTFPYSYTINNASASNYDITAKAIDNCNGSRTSGVLTINTTVSCIDGIQNGDETGVDCGGSSCTACSQGCSSPTNLSLGKTASQSSSYDGTTPASDAVDGSTSSSSWQCSALEIQPWWQVDLGSTYQVSSIELTHRTGCTACTGRIKKFRVFVTTSPVSSYSTAGYVYEYTNTTGLGNGQVLNIPNLSANGRYVRIWVDNGSSANWMHFAEVKVMGCAQLGALENQQNNIGILPITEKNSMYLFPNPVKDFIHLQFETQSDSKIQFQFFNSEGRILDEGLLKDGKFNMTRFGAGIYFLYIFHNGRAYRSKVIKI